MKEIDTKSWLLIAASFVASYWGYWLHQKWTQPVAIIDENFNYEMPRPKSYFGEFDLSGREVNKTVLGETKDDKNTVAKLAPGAAPNAPGAQDKKKEDKKKMAEKKKKPKVDVNVVDTSRPPSLTVENAEVVEEVQYVANDIAPVKKEEKQKITKSAEDDDVKIQEWKALLRSHPTQENAQAFYQAYKEGEVTEAQYQQTVSELLKDPETNRQEVALYLLELEPSVKSFQKLMAYMKDLESAQQASFRVRHIDRYGDASRLSILAQVFYLSDKETLTEATRLLTAAVQKAQTQQNTPPSGSGGEGNNQNTPLSERGRSLAATPPVTANSLSGFIPGLQRVVQSGDPTLAPAAQNLLSSIQTLLKV